MQTFYSQAAQAVHAYPERRYSIVRMDIDRFKVINDLYGLEEGDKLLIAIADLLREKMAGNHSVYGRLGGDVFCLCVDYSRERILALRQKASVQTFFDTVFPNRISNCCHIAFLPYFS